VKRRVRFTYRGPLLVRIARARPRLFSSVAVGIGVAVLLTLTTAWARPTRWLLGWDIGITVYLVLVAHLMATAEVDNIRHRAALEDEGQGTILCISVLAPLACLVSIFAGFGPGPTTEATRQPAQVALAMVTVLLSWAFIHTMFALHYAHEFYDESAGGGMAFPGDEREPDYWDFVYFSFVVGMTSQVSDVAVTTKRMRRLVVAHGLLAFVFNVALLALTVNLAASAI
jgi:uncharacterized membrane protein